MKSIEKEMKGIDPNDLIGRTYLKTIGNDGDQVRMKVISYIDRKTRNNNNNKDSIKFISKNGDESYQDIITYNQLLDKVEEYDNSYGDGLTNFQSIVSHEGPLNTSDPRYKGSKWNFSIKMV